MRRASEPRANQRSTESSRRRVIFIPLLLQFKSNIRQTNSLTHQFRQASRGFDAATLERFSTTVGILPSSEEILRDERMRKTVGLDSQSSRAAVYNGRTGTARAENPIAGPDLVGKRNSIVSNVSSISDWLDQQLQNPIVAASNRRSAQVDHSAKWIEEIVNCYHHCFIMDSHSINA
jgi:hypothetical protein